MFEQKIIKPYCYICKKKINVKSQLYSVQRTRHIKLNMSINQSQCDFVCSNCFNEDLYFDLLNLINNENDFGNDINQISFIKLTICKNKIWVHKKLWKRYLNQYSKQKQRKDELINRLNELKMKYSENGICGAYIKFGYPELEIVIKSLHQKQEEYLQRFYDLIEELKKNDLEYENDIPSYKKYLKYGGCLNEIIKEAEFERELISNTNYLNFLKNNDPEIAKRLSINEYIEKGGNKDIAQKYAQNQNTLRFE